MLTAKSCELFNLPFFQFSQIKKFQPEALPQIKSDYQQHWRQWKQLIQQIYAQLPPHFAKPHIESWTNGWQVRAHFFAFFKYQYLQHSAAILSIILNRRRLQVCLDWHSYRANRSQTTLAQYNQWWDNFDYQQFADFEIWRGSESEYNDFPKVSEFNFQQLSLSNAEDFWCIGKNIEKQDLANTNVAEFIVQTLIDLAPLYEKCHQDHNPVLG